MSPSPPFPVRRAIEWLPELLFLAVTTAVGFWAGGRWLDPTGDPGFSWSLAYRVGEGEVLYRDVYLAYGPLSPYLLAGIGRLFDYSAAYFVASTWIAAAVAGVLLLRCGRPFLSTLERVATAGLILALSLWAPGPGRLVFPYYPGVVHALALSVGAILVVRNPRLSVGVQSALGGLLTALAFLAKQEIGVAAVIAVFASYLLRPDELLFRGARTVAAFAAVIGVVFAAILLLSDVTVETLQHQNHLWPLDPVPPIALNKLFRIAAGTISPGWAFDVRQAAWSLLVQIGLLAFAGLLAARTKGLSRWLPVLALAFTLLAWWVIEIFQVSTRIPVALSATVAFLVALIAVIDRRLDKREHLVALGIFAGLAGLRAVFSPTLSGAFDGPAHFATSLTWLLFFCLLAPRILVREPRAAEYTRRITAVVALATAALGAYSGAKQLHAARGEPVSTVRGTIFLDPQKALFYRSLAREIRRGQTLLVIPEINGVDVVFHARSVSPLQDHVPGWLDDPVENELLRRFEKQPPEAVIVFERTLHELGAFRFGHGYGRRIDAWLAERYRAVLSQPAGTVFRRKGPAEER